MQTIGIIFLCVVACLAVWCMAKFGVFAPCFERPERLEIFKEKELRVPCPPEWVKFNLNDEIRVKLTDLGYGILANDHNEIWFPGHVQRDADSFKEEADAEGYTAFQAWQFMEIFGPSTGVGVRPSFATEILIRGSSIREYTPKV